MSFKFHWLIKDLSDDLAVLVLWSVTDFRTRHFVEFYSVQVLDFDSLIGA